MEQQEEMIMAALSTLSPHQLSDLTHSILSRNLHHHHRLFSLLSSPSAFSLVLHHLQSLSLSDKTLLVANHLLSSLRHLTRHFHTHAHTQTQAALNLKHRDLDAALLLLLLCDVHQQNPEILIKTPSAEWRGILSKRCLYDSILTLHSGLNGAHYGGALLPHLEMIIRCWNFVRVMGSCSSSGGNKEGKEVTAAPAAVVALPSVEVKGGGRECGICKEEMRRGRDVCELPCKHLFHWMCILPWLTKRNTCPYCRFQLPTEDGFGEIQRLWNLLINKASSCGSYTAAVLFV